MDALCCIEGGQPWCCQDIFSLLLIFLSKPETPGKIRRVGRIGAISNSLLNRPFNAKFQNYGIFDNFMT